MHICPSCPGLQDPAPAITSELVHPPPLPPLGSPDTDDKIRMRPISELAASSEPYVPLTAVGGCTTLVKADVHREGALFATYYVVGTSWDAFGMDGVESEGGHTRTRRGELEGAAWGAAAAWAGASAAVCCTPVPRAEYQQQGTKPAQHQACACLAMQANARSAG